ncbi:MAG: hypothetical protein ABGX22_24085 [Pirellulaceae bacterium]
MSDQRDPDATIRRCQRVLLMVHELHKRGYQLLRIVPGLNASGTSWRCGVTPRSNTLKSHGAMSATYDRMAKYTSASENQYFEWTDATTDTARQLADKFVDRFPEIVSDAQGRDWEYCGWYVQMLGFADRKAFPIAYCDFMDDGLRHQKILQTFPETTRELPFPPPGDAEERR